MPNPAALMMAAALPAAHTAAVSLALLMRSAAGECGTDEEGEGAENDEMFDGVHVVERAAGDRVKQALTLR